MKSRIIKTLFIGIYLTVSFTIFSPALYAQSNLFDTLDNLKEDVANQEKGTGEAVDLVDFSTDNPWGNVPPAIADALDTAGFNSLADLAKKAGYLQNKGNVQDLIDFIKKQVLIDKNNNDLILSEDEVNLIVNEIRFKGESQLRNVVLSVAKVIRNLIGGLAILWIAISGVQMIFAQGDESRISEQKTSITYAVIGLAAILLIDRAITIIYGVPGVERGITTTGEGLNTEILGVVSFIKALIGAIAMLMIVVSGVRTIASQGEEEEITNQKKSVLWIIIGIVLIVISQFVVNNLYIEPVTRQLGGETQAITQSNVINLINLFGTVTQFVLGFTGIVAFAALIYGAASMVANYGNDETVESAKKIIKNALIGIVIILSAFAIVSTVIKFS